MTDLLDILDRDEPVPAPGGDGRGPSHAQEGRKRASTLPYTIGKPVYGKVGQGPLEGVKASEVRMKGLAGGDSLHFLPFLGLEGYVVSGWSHLVAGYPKAGKTELITRLCQEWRDEDILYFTEEPRSIWEARLSALPGEWDHMTLVFALGAEPGRILETIYQSDATVVVIDTVRNLLGIRDETDNSEVARVLNPFIAACREREATLLLSHHVRKGGGEHGEGITGGHAFLGVVDLALEVLRADGGNDRQRKVRGWGRILSVPELLYQLREDGTLEPLGSPSEVALERAKERVCQVVNSEWCTLTQVWESLDKPRASKNQVREALNALAREGRLERDPPIAENRPGRTYRYRVPLPDDALPPTLPYMGTPIV